MSLSIDVKLVYMTNDNKQNCLFCVIKMLAKMLDKNSICRSQFNHLDTQIDEQTNQNSIKVPKVDKPTNKKTLLKSIGK